jgi:hypothetical protein
LTGNDNLTVHVDSAGDEESNSEVCPLTIGLVIDLDGRTTFPGGESLLFRDEEGRCDADRLEWFNSNEAEEDAADS